MHETAREREPNLLPVFFPVDPEIPSELQLELGADPEARIEEMIDAIEADETLEWLSQSVYMLTQCLGLEDDLRARFGYGFVCAYTLFCMQAALYRQSFPEIDAQDAADFVNGLADKSVNIYDYFSDRFDDLDDADEEFVAAIDNCNEGYGELDSFVFTTGAFMLYDVLQYSLKKPLA